MSSAFDRRYYETAYRHYARQNPPRKLHHYRAAVLRHVPPVRPLRLLDIGCAFGAFLGSLDAGWQRYGVDASAYAIERARAQLPGVPLEVSSGVLIPFAERFDAITAWDVFEHIERLDDVAVGVRDHLTDDGVLLFVVPVYDGPLGGVVSHLDRDTTHVHRVARQFWLDWAARSFQLVDWWGIFRILLPGGVYVHWPTRRLRSIAPAIAVVARR